MNFKEIKVTTLKGDKNIEKSFLLVFFLILNMLLHIKSALCTLFFERLSSTLVYNVEDSICRISTVSGTTFPCVHVFYSSLSATLLQKGF